MLDVTVKVIKKAPSENLKKSKLLCSVKNETFPETLYDRLDLDPSVSSEFAKQEADKFSAKTTIQEQKGIYTEIGRLMTDTTRRLAYDALKVTTIHDTCQKPGTTHHLPGMHQVIKQVVPEGVLQRYPDIWSRAPKAKDVTHKLKCSLEEFYNGKRIKLKIARQVPCSMCNGLGTYRPPENPMNGILCPTCQGKKTERKPNMLEFKLIPGVRNGFRKKLKGEGDMPPQQIASDIYLVAEQKPHPLYIRSGSDLILALELTLAEHLTGCTKFVKHLAENPNKTYKILKLNIPPLKKKIVILGKGMPKTSLDAEGALSGAMETPKTYGNLIIDILVDFPEKINPKHQDILKALVPKSEPDLVDSTDLNMTLDPQVLEKVKSIGDDKYLDDNRDRDRVADGNQQCPIS